VSQLNVFDEMLVQGRAGELESRLGHIATRGFDGDVVVLLEVDASVLLGGVIDGTEELTLNAGVGGPRNVLAIAPLAIAGAAGSVVGTTATVATFVSTAVTSATATSTTPSTATAAALERRGTADLGAVAPVVLASTVVLVSPVAVGNAVRGSLAARNGTSRDTGTSSGTRARVSSRSRAGTTRTSVGSGNRARATGTVHGRTTTRAVTHVGRDVGAVLGMATLLLALGAEAEATHVKLVRHVDVEVVRLFGTCVRAEVFRKGRQTRFTLVIQRKRE